MGNKSDLTPNERAVIQSTEWIRPHQIVTGSSGYSVFTSAEDEAPAYIWPTYRMYQRKTISFESKWDEVYKELFGNIQIKLNKNTKVI